MISLLSGLSLQTKALLIAGVFIAGFTTGWQVHGWKTKAGQGASLSKQLKTSDTIANNNKKIVKEAQTAITETKIIYRTIKERIHDENDTRICFADSTALGLWNDAIAGKDSPRPIATGKTSEPYAIDATVEQVLSNATENFETCNTNSIKHNALIDAVNALDGKMCVCAE
ncbi:MAG: hypothetical protein CTY37_05325 [Methylotenera sp.]|nr:MAG: hypothetical protein CTY37_05325 [Methylotenera sp.]